MEHMLRNKKTILSFLLPALLVYLGIVIVPIVNSFYNSFYSWNILSPRRFVGLSNYIQLMTSDEIFLIGLKNTFLLMALSLVIQVPLAILLAIALGQKIRGKGYFKTVFFFPNILSSVAVGLLWSFIYNPDFGMINRILEAVGLKGLTHLWLADEKTVLPSIIVTICWQFVGYHMVLYLAAVENIPSSMNEAAQIDGVSRFQNIIYITLPLIRPIIVIDAVLIATGSLRFFDLIYVMSNGGPNHASEVMASYMYVKSFRDMQYGYGSAVSVLLLVLCLGVTVVLNRVFRTEDVQY